MGYAIGTRIRCGFTSVFESWTIERHVRNALMTTPHASPTYAWLPFGHWHLHRNPFGELTREQRTVAAVVETASLQAVLAEPQGAIQFIGHCGHGKTTHMLALLACYPQATYVYLPPDGPCPPIPTGTPLFIDEAQRLPWRRRREVLRRGGPLVLGTHRDLTSSLKRANYRVHTVNVSAKLSAHRLCEILNRRIALASLGTGTTPHVDLPMAQRLIDRFGHNVRAIEDFLYERIQQYSGVTCGEMRLDD